MIAAHPVLRWTLFSAWSAAIMFVCVGFMIEALRDGNVPYVLSGFAMCILLMLCVGVAAFAAWLATQAFWRARLDIGLSGATTVGTLVASVTLLAILPWWIAIIVGGLPGALAAANSYKHRTI